MKETERRKVTKMRKRRMRKRRRIRGAAGSCYSTARKQHCRSYQNIASCNSLCMGINVCVCVCVCVASFGTEL